VRVIDASSLAKYVNRESNWREIESYLIDGCITVDLAIKEVLNSIWKRILRRELSKREAYKVAKGFLDNIMVKTFNQNMLLEEAVKISLKYLITIYDSLYISLAKRLSSELITSDEKQREAALKEGVKVIFIP